MTIKPQAFTLRAKNGLLPALMTECHVCLGFDPLNPGSGSHPPFHDFTALWDTGATGTVINQRVIDRCVLKPVGKANSETANGIHVTETYLVNLRLINGVAFPNVVVTRGNFAPTARFDVLIGMDIITAGDFAITNKGGKTVFSFRTPSCEVFDFVKDIDEKNKPPKWDPWHKKRKRRDR